MIGWKFSEYVSECVSGCVSGCVMYEWSYVRMHASVGVCVNMNVGLCMCECICVCVAVCMRMARSYLHMRLGEKVDLLVEHEGGVSRELRDVKLILWCE